MGRLRVAVLAHALAGLGPADVVKRVDTLLDQMGTDEVATMVYVVADPEEAGWSWPTPVTHHRSSSSPTARRGRWTSLMAASSVCVPPLPRRHEDVTQISSGGHFLLYTDGLIEPLERAGQDGIAHLCRVAEGFAGTAQELCDHVIGELAPEGTSDDICVLAATLTAQPHQRRRGRRRPRQLPVRAINPDSLSRSERR